MKKLSIVATLVLVLLCPLILNAQSYTHFNGPWGTGPIQNERGISIGTSRLEGNGEPFQVFCADLEVTTGNYSGPYTLSGEWVGKYSDGMLNKGTNDIILYPPGSEVHNNYSAEQLGWIGDIFLHVSPQLTGTNDTEYSWLNRGGDMDTDWNLYGALQFAVWKIGGETDETLKPATNMYAQWAQIVPALELADSWIYAAQNGNWDEIGYGIDPGKNYTVTLSMYQVNGGMTVQPLLAWNVSEVPEPATIAILGLGMIGAGLVARRRKK
ncbi:MAG: PEP-CTERM sorting domain-containing protein [Thermoguttaceae bacterium]